MKITNEMIRTAYDVTKLVHSGSISMQQGKENITRESGMNSGSAANYIYIITCLLEGEEYHRAMSLASTAYYLKKIGEDFGHDRQVAAARAVIKHTEYYKKHCNGEQVSTLALATSYLGRKAN